MGPRVGLYGQCLSINNPHLLYILNIQEDKTCVFFFTNKYSFSIFGVLTFKMFNVYSVLFETWLFGR